MEQLLHYIWKHKIFPLNTLYTTGGLSVEVIDTGLHNSDSGPDFFNAKLKIDGTVWVGNVEIHMLSSDWYRHGHDRDKVYDSVILHVVSTVDCEVLRSNGEHISQIQLTCPEKVKSHYDELCCADKYPPCHSIISSLSPFMVHSWLTALQVERFGQKTKQIEERLKRCNGYWTDAFFITIARNFGFGLNGDAFEYWAGLLPFGAIKKYRDDLFQVEAFFFGQAGLLEKEDGDEYYIRLRKEFLYMQHVFDLPSMDATRWRFLRLRPDNFPYIRIAQLAYLYKQGEGLFSKLMEIKTLKEVRELLSIHTSAYWEDHYIFGRLSVHQEKTVGVNSLNLIIINTVIPFLYAYGAHKSQEELCNRAVSFLEELKVENNYITRKWNKAGLSVATAGDSQALIQLQKEYCDKKKCLFCRFGYEFLRR